MNRFQSFTRNTPPVRLLGVVMKGAIALSIVSYLPFALSIPAWANDTSPAFGGRGSSGGDSRPGATYGVDIPDFSRTGRSDSDSRSGVTRSGSSDCTATEPFTPLVPLTADGGYTTQAQPTFWVYIPFTLSEASPVFFALVDETNDSIVHETRLPIQEPGIHNIELPPSIELQTETPYKWFIQIYCDDPDQMDVPLSTNAWIERIVSPSLLTSEAYAQMSPVEKSIYYAEQLIWYDALSVLGNALLRNEGVGEEGDRLETAWDDLLTLPSVQLDSLADEPLIDCCTRE